MIAIYQAMMRDDDGKPYRLAYWTETGKPAGKVYKYRARFGGHHHPIRNGFKFEPDGLPTRDPIGAATLRELRERLAEQQAGETPPASYPFCRRDPCPHWRGYCRKDPACND